MSGFFDHIYYKSKQPTLSMNIDGFKSLVSQKVGTTILRMQNVTYFKRIKRGCQMYNLQI